MRFKVFCFTKNKFLQWYEHSFKELFLFSILQKLGQCCWTEYWLLDQSCDDGLQASNGTNGSSCVADGEVAGYQCPLCDAVLPDLLTIRAHIDNHYPRDSPVCPVPQCAKVFSHPNSVRNHMRTKHSVTWVNMKRLKWTYV